jgi:hypothetical protein
MADDQRASHDQKRIPKGIDHKSQKKLKQRSTKNETPETHCRYYDAAQYPDPDCL